jgi:copper(I)-binding protein
VHIEPQVLSVLWRRTIRSLILILLIGSLVACAPAGPELQIEDVWARPGKVMEGMSGQPAEGDTEEQHDMEMAPGMVTSAVFMKLVNKGRQADRLVSAQTDVAKTVEIHETRMENEVMKMHHLPDGLEIPAKGEVVLKPGSYHVMLIGLTSELNVGDRFAVVLTFEKSGTMAVEAEVRQP